MEIVCLDSSGVRYLKDGAVYVIRGLMKSLCNCCNAMIDVGISDGIGTSCFTHNVDISDDICWYKETRFAPLEYDQQAIEELLSITTPCKQPTTIQPK